MTNTSHISSWAGGRCGNNAKTNGHRIGKQTILEKIETKPLLLEECCFANTIQIVFFP